MIALNSVEITHSGTVRSVVVRQCCRKYSLRTHGNYRGFERLHHDLQAIQINRLIEIVTATAGTRRRVILGGGKACHRGYGHLTTRQAGDAILAHLRALLGA